MSGSLDNPLFDIAASTRHGPFNLLAAGKGLPILLQVAHCFRRKPG